jgi:hypothetical protein
LFLFDCVTETVETRLPYAAVVRHPGLKLPEGLRAQRIEASLSVWAYLDEACIKKDAQMPRDSGLMDVQPANDIVHLTLAAAQDLDDPAAGRVGNRLEDI